MTEFPIIRRKSWAVAAAALLAMVLAACATPPQAVTVLPPAATDAQLREGLAVAETPAADYRIAVNDELEVKFPDQASLNETVRVRPDGNISLQVIGTVRAEGLTPDQLQEAMLSRLREQAQVGSKEYVIRANDELEVRFLYQPTLNERQIVRPDGKLTLPYVNTVIAEGKTPEQLTAELRKRYSKSVRQPELVVIVRNASVQSYRVGNRMVRSGIDILEPTVIVRSYSAPQIFVGGEVARPGVLAYRRNTTLMQAIVEAGGYKSTAELGGVVILRKSNASQPLAIRRDLRGDVNAESSNDILLEPFDVVILPKTAGAKLADLLEQNVYNILLPLKNSAFTFLYQMNPVKSTETKLVP